ncbi:DNA-formamidopyrimidine glycosylase family protein [Cellulomonas soli]|uniref:Formamidopyrimidine-DNA glycosylase n=1 Tax=Cellulomonas soli TaxID=931535 RepID=A0A512P8A4_9CELL|nr:DNA-formamidopyrimidine glycosylase family protein [Cellulomonas soli]NYI57656.1 formamidopyrimidine-DNA glycosylase [Cellulomonas soli]GEP67434.1 formamidopyrimidine-DNA glycosylase [Cellulomonas soli]
MIELPEAVTFAAGLDAALSGRVLVDVRAGTTPHRFASFSGDPGSYGERLTGRVVVGAAAYGGLVLLDVGDGERLALFDGAYPRLHAPGAQVPGRHQLRLDLDDGSVVTVTVQMYGGLHLVGPDEPNRFLAAALAAPSPLSSAFDDAWVAGLWAQPGVERGSVKAFLATQQRIPGLGNGVLQDICWNAGLHPRHAVATLDAAARADLVDTVRSTLAAMVAGGGRDTEKGLSGEPGGYRTVLSRRTLELPCPRCGGRIVKETYLGGGVYFCTGCQE